MKKSFSLLTTLILVVAFSFLSIKIIQNQNFSNEIDKLKYFEIQGKLHILKAKNDPQNFTLDDTRFSIDIHTKNENNNTIYHIYLKANNYPISLYEKVYLP